MDAAAEGDKRKDEGGQAECNGTSNNNMPAISRGDALMRDATGGEGGDETEGGEGERRGEREETAHRGACCVSSRDG